MSQERENIQRYEPPGTVIDRIKDNILSGNINPHQLLNDASYLMGKAGKEGQRKVKPFLQEAIRLTPPGVMQVALIDRLEDLHHQNQLTGTQIDTIRHYIQLGKDLNVTSAPAGKQFIKALEREYSKKPSPQPEYVWRAPGGDIPVKIVSSLGIGSDGREYVAIEGSNSGIPLDELIATQSPESTQPSRPEDRGGRRWKQVLSDLWHNKSSKSPVAADIPTSPYEDSTSPPSEIDPKTEAKVQNLLRQFREDYTKAKSRVDAKRRNKLISDLRQAFKLKEASNPEVEQQISELYSHFIAFNSLLDPHKRESQQNKNLLEKLLQKRPSILATALQYERDKNRSYTGIIIDNITIVAYGLQQIPDRTLAEDTLIQTTDNYLRAYQDLNNLIDWDLTMTLGETTEISAGEVKQLLQVVDTSYLENREALMKLMAQDNELFDGLAKPAGIEIAPGKHGHPASLRPIKIESATPPPTSATPVETPRQPTIEEVHEKMRQQIRQQYGDTGSFVLQFTPNQNLTQDEYMQADAYTKLAREAFQVGEIIYDKQTGILTIPLSPQNQKTATPDSDNEQEAWAKKLAQESGVDLEAMKEFAEGAQEELKKFDEEEHIIKTPKPIPAVEIFNTQIHPFVEGKGQSDICLQGVEEFVIRGPAKLVSLRFYLYSLGLYADIQQRLLNEIRTRTVGLQEGTHTSDALDRALSMAELLGLDRFGRCRETLQQARQALKEASLSSDAEKPDIFAGPTPFLPDLDGGSTLPDFTKLADTLEHKSGQDDTRTLAKEAENERAAQERAEQMAKEAKQIAKERATAAGINPEEMLDLGNQAEAELEKLDQEKGPS